MKGRKTRAAALAMAAVMAGMMLAGCGSDNKDSGSNTSSNTQGEASSTADAANGDERAAYFQGKDHYTLKIMCFGDADTTKLEEISEKLSEYTEPALNCDVELTRVGFASYMQQLNLMLSSGDEFDLFIPMASPIDYVNAGQIQPVDDLVKEYAPELDQLITEEDRVTQTFAGEWYGLPTKSINGFVLGFGMRKDVCDELGIDYENMSSWDDLHDALVKVKEAHPEMYPIVSNGGNMFGSDVAYTGQDSCGDSYNLAVLEDPFDENGKIQSWFETDEFKEVVERMYAWSQEGLIMPDASTNADTCNTLVAAGKGFGYFQHMKPGWETEQSVSNQTETVAWRYGKDTYTGTTTAWFVPTSSGDPERAVAFWEMMYTNKDVANLVINGIEGEDYVVVDEANGIIDYPEGKDSSTATYSRLTWEWPNQEIGYFWKGEDTTLWDQYDEFNSTAEPAVSFGFTFDATPVMNEITACTNVYQKYVPALLCGSLDPDTTIPVLNEEMEKAGIQKIVDEKQKQFDEWKASK